LSLKLFMEETASESVAPGGGSVSAYIGALGIALGTMVANLSIHKRGWDERWEEFSVWASKGKELQNRLLLLVDEDTEAYNNVIMAFRLPKNSDEENRIRNENIQVATKNSIMIPYKMMENAYSGFELIKEMVIKGNPNSVTDAGVGALALKLCISGAFLNIKVNAFSLGDKKYASEIIVRAGSLEQRALNEEADIIRMVEERVNQNLNTIS
jgi:glutamate formiminotransferase / formiminotetrahydrofolate cyclodeaminase